MTELAFFKQRLAGHPITVLDIGARGGLDKRWAPLSSILRAVFFEADEAEYQRLQSQKNGHAIGEQIYVPAALDEAKGSQPLHLTQGRGCCSLLEPNSDFVARFPDAERYRVEKTLSVQTETLDGVLQERALTPEFLKLDVQGAELRVLKGASQALATSLFGIEIEVEFAELYKRQPLFSQIDSALRESGFVLFDLKRHWWKRGTPHQTANLRGQLVFGEALYFKDYLAHPDLLRRVKPDEAPFHLIKCVLLCAFHQKQDYGLELVQLGLSENILSKEDAHAMETLLKSESHPLRWLPNIRGRYRLARWLIQLSKILAPRDWAASDTTLS